MKNLLKITLTLQLAFLSLLPVFTFAQDTTSPNPSPTALPYKISIPSPLNSSITDIPSLIKVVIQNIIIPIGAVIAVLMIMYAGFLFVTAQGNQAKITAAKSALLNAAIGAAILLGADLLASAISNTVKLIAA